FLPKPGRKFKRINIVAGQINGKSVAVKMYDWAMTAVSFQVFKYELCPILRENSTVYMDNVSFHRKLELKKLHTFINAISFGFRHIFQTKIRSKNYGRI
ncbi:MAG: hypothetical protein LBJ32_02665, partial [Oscillospiraceae bacterium]|nr:hypothetical protein [Oscillospiraceae bacterium]